MVRKSGDRAPGCLWTKAPKSPRRFWAIRLGQAHPVAVAGPEPDRLALAHRLDDDGHARDAAPARAEVQRDRLACAADALGLAPVDEHGDRADARALLRADPHPDLALAGA